MRSETIHYLKTKHRQILTSSMTPYLTLLMVVGICCQCLRLTSAAAATMSTVAGRYPRRLQQSIGYLPPYSNGDTSTNVDQFRSSPQVSSKTPTQHFKAYSSYAPPASGAAAFQYSAPQASNKIPLPSLIPKSVFEQLSMSMTQYQQQQQHQQPHIQPEVPTAPGSASPVLVVEEPSMLLTPNQNKTLQAARFLASTLLEANGEALLDLEQTNDSDEGAQDASNKLNSTDLVIVKSQKNAYIIPTQMARGAARSPMAVRELYQMRDQLDKAYTINQFIFIIKPEKINFLNKLV